MNSILIDKIETVLIDVPIVRPHVLSMATMNKQTSLLLTIHFSDGTVGLGEATTIKGLSYVDESPEGIKLVIDTFISPLLLKQEFHSISETMLRISQNIKGNRFAKCTVETALLDALGHRLGAPVSDLLGGRTTDKIPVAWVLASGDLNKDIDEAEEMLDSMRHKEFKIKIGKRAVSADVAHVAAIKKVLGDKASVRVDINQSWSRSQANKGVPMLQDAGVDLIEQPLDGDDIFGARRLVNRFDIAIMADECLHGTVTAYVIAKSNAANVFSIKIAQSGGLYPAQQVASIANAAGISLYGGTMLETSIGTIASAHLFSTFNHIEWGTELFAPLLLKEQIVKESFEYKDFSLHIPNKPGLGISLDEDKVKFYSR